MGIRHYKPTSPGRRDATVSDFAEITDRKKATREVACCSLQEKGRSK